MIEAGDEDGAKALEEKAQAEAAEAEAKEELDMENLDVSQQGNGLGNI